MKSFYQPLVVDFQGHLSDICHGPGGRILQGTGGKQHEENGIIRKRLFKPGRGRDCKFNCVLSEIGM